MPETPQDPKTAAIPEAGADAVDTEAISAADEVM